jgi:hypothetical protein
VRVLHNVGGANPLRGSGLVQEERAKASAGFALDAILLRRWAIEKRESVVEEPGGSRGVLFPDKLLRGERFGQLEGAVRSFGRDDLKVGAESGGECGGGRVKATAWRRHERLRWCGVLVRQVFLVAPDLGGYISGGALMGREDGGGSLFDGTEGELNCLESGISCGLTDCVERFVWRQNAVGVLFPCNEAKRSERIFDCRV